MATNNIVEVLKNLDLEKLVNHFMENAGVPHVCSYHKEAYDVHCLCVIGYAIAKYEAGEVSEELLLAACLHDVKKPQKASVGKDGQAHFYGHEHVTDEELAVFINPEYHNFARVAELVRGHSLPWQKAGSKKLEKRYDALIEKYGREFGEELEALVDCDHGGGVVEEANLPAAIEEAERVKAFLLQIAAK